MAIDQRIGIWEVTEVLRAGYTGHNSDPAFSLRKDTGKEPCLTFV